MKRILYLLSDVFLELLIGAVFVAVGFGISCAFGWKGSLFDLDPELLALIGVLALAVAAAVVFLAVKLVKRIKKRKNAVEADASDFKKT